MVKMLTKATLPLKRYVEYRNGFLKALAFSFHELIRPLILIWDYPIKLYYFPSPGHALNLNKMPKQKHSWNPLYNWCVFLSILQHLIPCSLPSGGSPVWPISTLSPALWLSIGSCHWGTLVGCLRDRSDSPDFPYGVATGWLCLSTKEPRFSQGGSLETFSFWVLLTFPSTPPFQPKDGSTYTITSSRVLYYPSQFPCMLTTAL